MRYEVLILSCVLTVFFGRCSSEEEIIKSGPIKDWSKKRLSGTLNKGMLWNDQFSTCGTGQQADFIILFHSVSFANLVTDIVYVDVKASFTNCTDVSGENSKCYSDAFEVYMYQGDNDIGDIPTKQKDVVPFLTNTFNSLYNITGELDNSVVERTFTFLQNGYNFVVFAVVSHGACGKLYSMKMYYKFCPGIFFKNVKFEKTSSPAIGPKEVRGNCSQNTSPWNNHHGTSLSLKGNCSSNGTWYIDDAVECLCIAGYESNTTLGCLPCQPSYFKQNISNERCGRCPLNSRTINNGTDCECKHGFYNLTVGYDCYAPLAIVQPIKTDQFNSDSVNISWTKPEAHGGSHGPVSYQFECYCCGNQTDTSCKQECTGAKFKPTDVRSLKQTFLVASGLKIDQKYLFKIYPRNKLNDVIPREKWNSTKTTFTLMLISTREPSQTTDDGFTIYYIVGAAGVIAFILLACIVALIVLKRKSNEKRLLDGGFSSFDLHSLASHRDYIDPTVYAKPEDAVSEFTSELDPKLISVDVIIGGGEFGDVYKGKLRLPDKSRIPVAIKTLKSEATYKSRKDFLLEASVMGQFKNPNVVKLQGVVTKSQPRMIVLEYMSNGSLDNFLKSNYAKLTQLQLIGMARGVAGGMRYLSAIKFVHRDLAARNVLVNESLLCKISDFGLSRELDSVHEEYSTTGGKIPVRWTAPEAISYRKFSSASDVWSYGILLWEIFSFGQRPYGDWDNLMVMAELDRGYRLPSPTGVHDLMLHCWAKERLDRPSFSQITSIIDKWIRSPEMMDQALDMSQSITKWLESIKMDTYSDQFMAAGYQRPVDIAYLSDNDLKKLGVTLIGHRNKILKNAVLLQLHESPSESVDV